MKSAAVAAALASMIGVDEMPKIDMPEAEQKELLKAHMDKLNREPLKVGDYVELNALGKENYRFPVPGQVAQVTRVFDNPGINNERHRYLDIEIAIVIPAEKDCDNPEHNVPHINTYITDSACYRKVESA